MKLIDSNIFLEILNDQDKADLAESLLKTFIEKREKIIVTSFTIHSIIVILERKKKLREVSIFIDNLMKLHNVYFFYPRIEEELEIIKGAIGATLDFDDYFQYYAAKKFNAEIITFDKHFKNIADIKITVL